MHSSKWKVPFMNLSHLKNDWSDVERSMVITQFIHRKKVRMYNGNKMISFFISKTMVGSKFGEFSLLLDMLNM